MMVVILACLHSRDRGYSPLQKSPDVRQAIISVSKESLQKSNSTLQLGLRGAAMSKILAVTSLGSLLANLLTPLHLQVTDAFTN